jgi:hypothetical protein
MYLSMEGVYVKKLKIASPPGFIISSKVILDTGIQPSIRQKRTQDRGKDLISN